MTLFALVSFHDGVVFVSTLSSSKDSGIPHEVTKEAANEVLPVSREKLIQAQKDDIMMLVDDFPMLVSDDVPSRTSVLQHDVDVCVCLCVGGTDGQTLTV